MGENEKKKLLLGKSSEKDLGLNSNIRECEMGSAGAQ